MDECMRNARVSGNCTARADKRTHAQEYTNDVWESFHNLYVMEIEVSIQSFALHI